MWSVCGRSAKALDEVRKSGVALGKAKGKAALLVLAGQVKRRADLTLGIALRAYEFTARKTREEEADGPGHDDGHKTEGGQRPKPRRCWPWPRACSLPAIWSASPPTI